MFTNRDIVRDLLGHSDHDMIEFAIFDKVRRSINKTSILDFQRAGLSVPDIKKVPWKAVQVG